MVHPKEGYTNSSLTRDSTSQALEAVSIPPSEGGMPSSPPQRRYETRRPSTTPGMTSLCLESSVRRPPAKRARTSHLGESSRPSQPDPRASTESQLPFDMSLEAIIKWPMIIMPPIESNSDCRAQPFHSELYFDLEVMCQQPKLWDSFGLLQRYHLERLMTPREFFYPIVVMDFYQSMTTRDVQSPTTIHFTIDECQGILEVRHIPEALHILYELVDPTEFREWSSVP